MNLNSKDTKPKCQNLELKQNTETEEIMQISRHTSEGRTVKVWVIVYGEIKKKQKKVRFCGVGTLVAPPATETATK